MFNEYSDFVGSECSTLTFGRRHSSALAGRGEGMFGPGWTSPLEARLRRGLDGYRLVGEAGDAEVTFDDPDGAVEAGGVARNLGAYQELRREGERYVVTRWLPDADATTRYIFARGERGRWWPLIRRLDGAGRGLAVAHDEAGRVASVTQLRGGRYLRPVYNPAGRVVEVRLGCPTRDGGADAGARERLVLRYCYDGRGLLCQDLDALDQGGRYRYDPAGRMVRERDRGGLVHRFTYDHSGRCVEATGEGGYGRVRLAFDPLARQTRVIDALGHPTLYQLAPSGQVERVTDPAGGEAATQYDGHGRVVLRISPAGAVTTHAYDARGDRVRVTGPGGEVTTHAFDAGHRRVATTDPAGHVWRREFDAGGRLVAEQDPTGLRLTHRYSPAGDLAEVVDAEGNRRTLIWDVAGDLVAASDWRGNSAVLERDEEGRLVAITDALGRRTEARLDALGRVLELHLPGGGRRTFGWDARHQPTRLTDELGAVTRWRHAPCGRLAEVLQPGGGRVRLRWSVLPGQLLAVENARGEEHRYAHDAAGHLVAETDTAGRVTRYEVDADGRAVVVLDSAGRRTELVRDPGGAVTLVRHDDGGRVTFARDARGLLVAADNGGCAVGFAYDAAGRLVAETQGEHRVVSAHDALGRRTRRASSLGWAVDLVRDADGLLEGLGLPGQEPLFLGRDACGDEVSRAVRGGVRIDRTLDARGRCVVQTVDRGGEVVLRREFTYDAASNLSRVWDSRGGACAYAHDAAGRLAEAQLPGGLTERFAYDAAGDLVSQARGPRGAQEQAHTRSPGGALTRRGRIRYTHDALGQLAQATGPNDEVTRYRFDRAGQLAEVTLPDGARWRYTYDPLGRRVKKEGPGQRTEYVWDQDVVLHELRSGSGEREVIHWEFDPQGFEPLAQVRGGALYLCVNDAPGNPRELVDRGGEVAWSALYRPWGQLQEVAGEPAACPVRYPGQWHDVESGLHYNRCRHFDPAAGGFLSPDPLGMLGQGQYGFFGSPLGWADPLGLVGRRCGPARDAPVSIKRLRILLGRAGVSVRDHAHGEEVAGAGIYGAISADGQGRLLGDGRGRPVIALTGRALASLQEAVTTVGHEVKQVQDALAGVTSLSEGGTEAAGRVYLSRFTDRAGRGR